MKTTPLLIKSAHSSSFTAGITAQMNDDSARLHIAMFPWLAMGHLLPFLELSKSLARRGHRISYLTTPSNIQKLLPNIPPSVSSLLHLIELRMPTDNPLPASVENTSDLPTDDLRLQLNIIYNSFQPQLSSFLADTHPDWLIYDYSATDFAQPTADTYGIPSTYLCLFNAATLCFFCGNPGRKTRTSVEDFTKAPDWIPFPTTIAYRPYEAREMLPHMINAELVWSTPTEPVAGFMAIRTCNEFEQKWLQLQSMNSPRPVVPVGLLPRLASPDEDIWTGPLASWLDKKEARSVVYVAFGSEMKLTTEQVSEVAAGLELSGLPFVWALRGSQLREGFEEQTAGRGIVSRDWVEQNRILGHASVGGFLTHGGWSSIIEGLSFGVALIILPFAFDQGLNARYLSERGIGVEVERDDDNGTFSREGIAKSLKLVMVEQGGEGFREKAREWKQVFGNEELQDSYVGEFVKHFLEHRGSSSNISVGQ